MKEAHQVSLPSIGLHITLLCAEEGLAHDIQAFLIGTGACWNPGEFHRNCNWLK